jgi:gamma-tubulin complex component 2
LQVRGREDLSKENLREDFNDTYWAERYSVRQDKLPLFLSAVSEKILTTGKYLNVILESGRALKSPIERPLSFSESDMAYAGVAEEAYTFASRELLDLLLKDQLLVERLRSIKRYFLLSQGDFFLHFMDIAGTELDKTVLACF